MKKNEKDFWVVNPHTSLWQQWREHLDWMLENYPARVQQLYEQGKLKGYLDRKAAVAWKRACALNDRGRSLQEALEIVSNDLLSPPDGPAMRQDPPPEPLPEKLVAEIWDWAVNLPEDPPTEFAV